VGSPSGRAGRRIHGDPRRRLPWLGHRAAAWPRAPSCARSLPWGEPRDERRGVGVWVGSPSI